MLFTVVQYMTCCVTFCVQRERTHSNRDVTSVTIRVFYEDVPRVRDGRAVD